MDATKDQPNDMHDEAATESNEPIDRIAALELEIAELKASRLRALADLQNTARRGVENESRALSQGVMGAARSILPVVDHVELALQQSGMTREQAMHGLSMLRDELTKALEKVGIEAIQPAVGDAFHPGVHEAVMRQAAEGVAANHISMVLQSGYRLADSVLRPAKVAVQPEE